MLNDPEVLRAIIVALGILSGLVTAVSAFITWKGRTRMQSLKNQYEDIKGDHANYAAIIAVLEKQIENQAKAQQATNEAQRISNENMHLIAENMTRMVERLDTSSSQTQQLIAQQQQQITNQQEANQQIAEIARSVVQENKTTRETVVKLERNAEQQFEVVKRMAETVVKNVDVLMRRTKESSDRHTRNETSITQTAKDILEIKRIIHELDQKLEAWVRDTSEHEAVIPDDA